MASQDARLSKFKADFKQQQSKITNKINAVLKVITDRLAGALPNDTVKNPKLSINSTTSFLSAHSYPTKEPQCSTHIHGSINAITIHPKQQNDSHDDKPAKSEEEEKDSLENTNTNPSASLDPSISFIIDKIVKKNDDSRKEEPEAGGLEIEQYNSLSDLEKEHMKSVYLRNKEDKRIGVEYVMSKILGFYKECLKLGPEYVTGMDDEGEVTFLALGWLLEEIHETWAHLEKKQTRLRTYTKSFEDFCIQWLETVSQA
ncbi:hypothetical protein Tco_0308089 [Tanacetum coccineum]